MIERAGFAIAKVMRNKISSWSHYRPLIVHCRKINDHRVDGWDSVSTPTCFTCFVWTGDPLQMTRTHIPVPNAQN